MSRKDCPAYDKKCDSCGILGHFKSVCEKSSHSRASGNNTSESEEDDYDLNEHSHSSTSFSFMARSPKDIEDFHKDQRNQDRR